MKKLNLTFGDKLLIAIYGLSLAAGITGCFFSESGELHQRINICIWILNTIMWFIGFKMVKAKLDNMKDAADIERRTAAQKAVTSAPSSFTTHDKTVYEIGFLDGVDFIKNEITKNN